MKFPALFFFGIYETENSNEKVIRRERIRVLSAARFFAPSIYIQERKLDLLLITVIS